MDFFDIGEPRETRLPKVAATRWRDCRNSAPARRRDCLDRAAARHRGCRTTQMPTPLRAPVLKCETATRIEGPRRRSTFRLPPFCRALSARSALRRLGSRAVRQSRLRAVRLLSAEIPPLPLPIHARLYSSSTRPGSWSGNSLAWLRSRTRRVDGRLGATRRDLASRTRRSERRTEGGRRGPAWDDRELCLRCIRVPRRALDRRDGCRVRRNTATFPSSSKIAAYDVRSAADSMTVGAPKCRV